MASGGSAGTAGPTPEEILAEIIIPHVDMPKYDLIFLLKRMKRSETIKPTIQALALKLKLEFGEELTKHKDQLDRAEKARRAAALKRQEEEKHERTLHDAELKRLAKEENRLDTAFRELRDYLLNNYVRSKILHVPNRLHWIYDECERQGIIEQPWLRRYTIKGSFENSATSSLRRHRLYSPFTDYVSR